MTDSANDPVVHANRLETGPEKKKKRVNSKKKGSNFENYISHILAGALKPMEFRRSQQSGAILGGKNAKLLDNFSLDAKVLFVGDVTPTNEADVFRDHGWRFRFTLECKFYKTPENIEHLIEAKRIQDWFSKAVTDSTKLGRDPLLIFKYNHTEAFCGIRPSMANPRPSTVKNTLTLDNGSSVIEIFLLKEALQDLNWWKIKS